MNTNGTGAHAPLPMEIPEEHMRHHEYQMAQRARLPELQQKLQQIQVEITKIQAANQMWHEFLAGELQMAPGDGIDLHGQIKRRMVPAPPEPEPVAPLHPAEIARQQAEEQEPAPVQGES